MVKDLVPAPKPWVLDTMRAQFEAKACYVCGAAEWNWDKMTSVDDPGYGPGPVFTIYVWCGNCRAELRLKFRPDWVGMQRP